MPEPLPVPEVVAGARRALVEDRRQLTLDELATLAALPDEHLPALADAAHAVRVAWCGDTVEIEGILSAKTGGAPRTATSAPSRPSSTPRVKALPLLTDDQVLAAARETAELGASEFCLVYAVRGPDERLMTHLEEVVGLVGRETGPQRGRQRRHPRRGPGRRPGRRRHPPLQPQPETARSFFGEIVTTHTWDERFATCRLVRDHGMELLRGPAGHGRDERAAHRAAGRADGAGPAEVPVNFLDPRPGTPLADRPLMAALEAIRWIALFRLALPDVILRYAGGAGGHPGRPAGDGHDRRDQRPDHRQLPDDPGPLAQQDVVMLQGLKMPIGSLSKVI